MGGMSLLFATRKEESRPFSDHLLLKVGFSGIHIPVSAVTLVWTSFDLSLTPGAIPFEETPC